MAQAPAATPTTSFWQSSGLKYIVRTLPISLQPSKLLLAFIALVLTFAWGGLLDWFWVRACGIEADAVTKFALSRQTGAPYVEGSGSHGPFELWRDHSGAALQAFLAGLIPGFAYAPAQVSHQAIGVGGPSALHNLILMEYGCWWMCRHHPFFAILFGGGFLLIWSLLGGAICRLAAMHIARDEKLTATQGVNFARSRLFGGFLLAPLVPIGFIIVTAMLMVLGGLVLRVPALDILTGLAFPLAILGGFVIATLMIGLALGGSLFWPAVAADGSDGFDAFSRGLSYVLSRPWKAILYCLLMLLYGAICWLVANAFIYLALTLTRGIVSVGASWFGVWPRSTPSGGVSKLELLWPMPAPHMLYAWPDWGQLAFYEKITAFFIGVCVLIVLGLLWAFLASFYLTGSTVVYFLLRADVDGANMDEVIVDEQAESGAAPSGSTESPPPPAKDFSLPVSES